MHAESHFLQYKHSQTVAQIAGNAYRKAVRTSLDEPGFALIRLMDIKDSLAQRRLMVELKEAFSDLFQARRGKPLGWQTMSRFDQKVTTKPHRDGGPAESLLILGYEPTLVKNLLSIADYTKCATDSGITPDIFLEEYNPMFEKGLELLKPYTTQLTEFDTNYFQILVINNSSCAYTKNGSSLLGVLHCAEIDQNQSGSSDSRVINSASISPMEDSDDEPVSTARLKDFLENSTINASNYT